MSSPNQSPISTPPASPVVMTKKKRGRPKAVPKSNPVVSESEEASSAGEASETESISAGEASEAESISSSTGYADEAEAGVLKINGYDILAPRNKKKELIFPDAECREVVRLIYEGGAGDMLSRRQLQIADALEPLVANAEYKDGKRSAARADKASFCAQATWSQPFFLELQNQYKQPNGNAYTLQAFQEAINHWFFQHINAGNAFAKVQANLRKNDKGKTIGVNMPSEFWADEFLGGYLHTEAGKHILDTAEEAMAQNRKAKKNSKAQNDTPETRKKNVGDAVKKMSKAEKQALLALLAEDSDDDE